MPDSESSRWLERQAAGIAFAGLGLLAALTLLVGSASGATDTVTLQASADTYVRSGAPDTNEGRSPFLRLRASGDNRALVRFDQAALQAAAEDRWLVSARLDLAITHNADNWSPSGRTVSVYRLTSPWEEGNGFVDQGSPPNRGTGSGATWECAADANIANQAKDCSGSTQWEMGKPNQPELHPWSEPATASVLITNGLTGTISFDVTDDVDAFLSEASENVGWIVKKDVEGNPGLVEFASRESGSSGPRLVLEFETVAPDERYAPDDPDTGPEGVPGEFEGPGGGAEGYDPDLNPDSACDAYVDFGIPDWCLDPGAVDNPPASAAATLRAGAGLATVGEYAGCGLEAVFWTPSSPMTRLIEKLKQWNVGAACGDYYFAKDPGPSDKLKPECFTELRGSWPANFHVAPVFHWTGWSNWIKESPGTRTWYLAGLEFRQRMALEGCQAGDRWFVNELHTNWRGPAFSAASRRKMRAQITSAARGLYYGSASNIKGFTADVVMPHDQGVPPKGSVNVYKAGLQDAYDVGAFWSAMNLYLEGWADEVYNRCSQVCVGNKTARQLADEAVNNYSSHQRHLALAAPGQPKYAQVKATMSNRYFPLLNAVWKGIPVYDSQIMLRRMIQMIRQQISSARRAAEFEYGSAGRVGFAWREAWNDGANNAIYADQLATNLARALRDAYRGDKPAAACTDNDGAGTLYYGCPPSAKPGAAINSEWDKLKTWDSGSE